MFRAGKDKIEIMKFTELTEEEFIKVVVNKLEKEKDSEK